MKTRFRRIVPRKILLLVLTLSTILSLSVLAVPAGALNAGDTVYLKVGDGEIDFVTATFFDGDDRAIQGGMVYMADEDNDGVYGAIIPQGAQKVSFYVSFEGDDAVSTSKLDLSSCAGNVYDPETGGWYSLGGAPAPDGDDDSDTSDTVVPDEIPDPDESGGEGESEDETDSTKYTDKEGSNSASINVSGTVSGPSDTTEVVSVDLSWGAMQFTYTPPHEGEWDPDQHDYVNGTAGGWESTSNAITVTNHSNAGIAAGFSFDAAESLDLGGEFRDESGAVVEQITLASAENPQGGAGTPASQTVTFHIVSGSIERDMGSLGMITVRISKAN